METNNQILLFLRELKTQLQNGKVKSINKIIEDFKLLPQVGTTIFEMGIVSKNRPYEWNDDFEADDFTASFVEQQTKLYQPVISSVRDVINIPDIENGFKIDFRKIWPCLGYSSQGVAKRSLLRSFKDNVDFEVCSAAKVDNELPGLSEDYAQRAEIIMLTLQCTLDFLTIVNMPMAKLYSRKMNEFIINRSKEREIPAVKLETMTITQKMAKDAKEVEVLARNFKTMLLDDLVVKLDNPAQMEFPYMDELMYDRRKLLLTQISELLNRQYNQKQLNYENSQNKFAIEGHRPQKINGSSLEVPGNKQLEPNSASCPET